MKDQERDELFARARRAASPTEDDRRRVRAALTRRLGVTGAVGAVAGASVGTTTTTAAASVAQVGATLGTTAATTVVPGVVMGASTLVVVKAVVAAVVVASVALVALPDRRPGSAGTETKNTSSVAPPTAPITLAPPQRSAGATPAVALPTVASATASAPIEPPAASASPAAAPSSRRREHDVAPGTPTNSPVGPVAAESSSSVASALPAHPGGSGIAGTSDEVRLVTEMQLALRAGDTARVLELVTDHERRFPASAWAPEREGARVLAVCSSPDVLDAPRLGQAFLDAHPRSPLAARVKAACHLETR